MTTALGPALPDEVDAALLRGMLAAVDDAVVAVDGDDRVVAVSPRARRLAGPQADPVGTPVADAFPELDPPLARILADARHRERRAVVGTSRDVDGVPGRFVAQHRVHDPVRDDWFEVAVVEPDEGGSRLVHLRAVTRLHRREVVDRVRDALRADLDRSEGPVETLATSTRTLREALGLERAELWTRHVGDASPRCVRVSQRDHPGVDEVPDARGEVPAVAEALERGQPLVVDLTTDGDRLGRDGTGVEWAACVPIRVDERLDAVIVLLAATTRVGRRWEGILDAVRGDVEQIIARQRERHGAMRLFHVSREIMAVVGFDGVPRQFNRQMEVVLGRRAEELVATPMDRWIHPEDVHAVRRAFARLAQGRPVESRTDRIVTMDGTVRYVSWSARPVVAEGLAYVVASDVTDRVAMRGRLRASEERFRLLADATSDAVWDWDVRSDTVWTSDEFATLFGYDHDEFHRVEQPLTGRIHEDDRERVVADMQRAMDAEVDVWESRYRFLRADGGHVWVQDRARIIRDAGGGAVRMIGGIVDLTERMELEDQLRRIQRIDSLGALAGGIAHNLNNVLAPIVMGADLLDVSDALDDGQRATVDLIRGSARRGAQMVRQILTFARGLDGERVVVEPGALLDDARALAIDTLPHTIEVHVDLADDVPPVLGDPVQLQQVLLNLVVNARDAMPDGGRLEISVEMADLAGTVADDGFGHGPFVCLTVGDDGPGIPAAIREQVFEPFFSTRQRGQGTGLGLSTSLAIVRAHGGFMVVDQVEPHGTAMRVYLPVAPEEELHARRPVVTDLVGDSHPGVSP